MRIALASALVFTATLLLQAAATGQEQKISAKQAYAKGDYAAALSAWRSEAGNGDAKAQVNLGRMYALGHGVDKDEALAISWFRKAADQESAVAHYNLGVLYETGEYRDLEAAARHYRIAAEDGRTEAQTALGKLYQHGIGVAQDYRAAAEWLEKAADDNDPEAQFLLGVFHAKGWGVERDFGEMLHWTRRSARQGHPEALFHMGLAYDQGIGIGRNPASAARFYAVAAKKGNSRAQARLGEMYFFGFGVEQSYPVALGLLTTAAGAGEASARYVLGLAYHAGKGVEKNAERGVAYFRRAADQGHLGAWNKLAAAYDSGDGVPENPEKAVELYRIGADAGDPSAQYSIALAYRAGRGVGGDAAEAVRWFLKAARGGHGDAQLALARMYRDGIGVGRNDRAALRWIDEAVRRGNAAAIAELAELHLAGSGVARDPERALELLRQAAGKGLRSAAVRLADLLAEGRLVTRDLVRAAKLYRRLAEKGDAHGTAMLAAFHLKGKGGIAPDAGRAAELFRIAANLGSVQGANMLAVLHHEGRGVEESDAETARWYKLAAAKGDYTANHALGDIYRDGLGVRRDWGAARRHYAKALAIRENSVGGDSIELTDVLLRLAGLDHDRGLNERAASYFRRAATILRGAKGSQAAYLEAVTGLVAVLRDLGRLDAADAVISHALESLGPGSEDTASIFRMSLGELYETLGRDARAAKVYSDVLATMKRPRGSGAGHDPGYNYVLAARARVLARLGHDDQAEADFVRVLTLMERHRRVGFAFLHARALGDYGRLLTRLDHFGEAVATFEKAEKLIDRIGLTHHPRGLAGAGDFALAHERQGRIDSAISVLRRAIAADTPAGRRLSRRIFLDYVRLLTRKPVSPERAAEAFEAAQAARSLELSSTMERIVARLATADDGLGAVMDARRRAIAAWRRIERRLVGPEAGFGRVAPEVLRNGFKELRALERKLDGLEAALRKRFPGVAALLSLAPVSLDEARRLLGPGEALITTLSDRREIHVWVVTKKAFRYHRAALGAGEIAAMVGRLRASLDPRRMVDADDIEAYPLELSAKLHNHLLAPARAVLDGISHVFYAPDGALRNLPLSVLVADLARAPADADGEFESVAAPEFGFARYREVVWFIDKHAYSRIPSLEALRALRSNPAASRAPQGFVGIGGIGDPALAVSSKSRGLRPIPETATGLRAMARGFGAGDDALHLGPRARESEVKALLLNQYRTVAFAAPGVVAGEIAGVAEPALMLTPPATATATASNTEDGLLTTSEIAGLDLDADLVVLGADVPDGEAGAQWLSGLARAFVHAGARSLMVAHWPVEREAATAFTTAMFAKRNDGGPQGLARLLQRSALEILNDETRPARFAHPMYWGAFTIIGDGGRRY